MEANPSLSEEAGKPLHRLRLAHPVRTWAIIAAVATFVGLVFMVRYYLLSVSRGSGLTLDNVIWGLVGWWVWIILTPLVFILAQRFPVERPIWSRSLVAHLFGWLGISLLDVTVFSVVYSVIGTMTGNLEDGFWMLFQHALMGSLGVDLLTYAGIVAVVHAIEYRRRYREREIAASQLQVQLARAQFQALEMQLQPHFLFNTLNTVYALIDEDVDAARRVLALLSELLRFTLRASEHHETPLRTEITFIERYLEIQQIRFKDQLDIDIQLAPDAVQARVPTLILQPIVENAFKHGLAPGREASRIVIRASRDENTLVLEVTDNGPGMPRKGAFPRLKKGVGLRNTEERLLRLYGPGAALLFEEAPGGGLTAVIRLPYQDADAYSLVET